MDAAEERKRPANAPADAHARSGPDRTEDKHGRVSKGRALTEDIDDLRRMMAETFLKEASFTADPVILISRQLDVKINEYMRQSIQYRKQAR